MRDVSFVEMGSSDARTTSHFFVNLFEWKFHTMDNPNGSGWFETDHGRIGLHGDDPQWGIVPYFRVDSIEAAVARVRELGGSAEERIADEEGFGRFCNCKDPNGLVFGLHEPPGNSSST